MTEGLQDIEEEMVLVTTLCSSHLQHQGFYLRQRIVVEILVLRLGLAALEVIAQHMI